MSLFNRISSYVSIRPMFAKRKSIVPLITALSLVAIPALFAFQSSTAKAPGTATTSLSKPADMGTTEIRLFPDTRKIRFKLTTSWIPGEKRQGMLRYKLSAWVNKPTHHFDESTKGDEGTDEPDDSEPVAKLLERVSHCKILLALYDKDQFILRQHVVPFIQGIDPEHARVSSLYANDAFQMESQEYRQFIVSGTWCILWSDCAFISQ